MGTSFYVSRFLLVVYPILGSSMEPTLHDREYVLLFRAKKLDRGDIIVFYVPEEERYLVKRIVGVEGDEIEISYDYDDACYHVYVNGEMSDEEFIYEPMNETYQSMSLTVAEGKLFVLGDNRNDSHDSHAGLLAEVANVEGVAFLKYKGFSFSFL